MYGATNVSVGGGASYTKMSSGTVTQTKDVIFTFSEIDTIANDSTQNLTLDFYDKGGAKIGSFVLKEGESLNDVHLKGSKIHFSSAQVNARYILLG